MRIEFFIPWRVAPKQSVRTQVVERPGRKPFAQHYQTKKIKHNAAILAEQIAPFRPPTPFEGAVRAWYRVVYPYRKNEPKKNRGADIPKATGPDCGQLSKQLDDVLQGCGFVANDAQIADSRTRKFWGMAPGITITVAPLADSETVGKGTGDGDGDR
jgi:Holliday junction resolvase RusA-like endonuclease